MKLFLVEDEVIALQSLQRKIEDLDEDYEIVGTASNGLAALSSIPVARPDVVLTDIRMPDMDGITLVEKLRERGSPVLPVIISGYQEFEYAKQAVRLGVSDYLLKPVNPEELAACLTKCAQRLKRQRSRENVTSFLVGDDGISIEFVPGEERFAVAYLVIANALSNLEHVQHPCAAYLPSAEVESLLISQFPNDTAIRCIDGFFSNEKALVLSGSGLEHTSLQSRLEKAAEALHRQAGDFITIFYRNTDSPRKLESSIRACRRGALENMMLEGDVVTSKNAPPPVPDEKLAERIKFFTLFLRQNQQEDLRKNIKKMFVDWKSGQRRAAEVNADLVFTLNALRHGLGLRQDFSFNSLFYVENLMCFSGSLEEYAEGFYQLLLELFRPEAEEKGISAEATVEQIDAYLRANLAENISLQSLSDEMGLSKVYLCRIFKKQKDMTPIDYFTRLKIDRARELIVEHPTMPLREISDALGFNDTYYFSKVFKRVTGVPPSELRTEKS